MTIDEVYKIRILLERMGEPALNEAYKLNGETILKLLVELEGRRASAAKLAAFLKDYTRIVPTNDPTEDGLKLLESVAAFVKAFSPVATNLLRHAAQTLEGAGLRMPYSDRW